MSKLDDLAKFDVKMASFCVIDVHHLSQCDVKHSKYDYGLQVDAGMKLFYILVLLIHFD
jgi:hypothetical protein